MSIAPGYGNTAELQRQVAALQARIAELEARNAASERDAGRWHWIYECDGLIRTKRRGPNVVGYCVVAAVRPGEDMTVFPVRATVREAIDAAIDAHAQGQGGGGERWLTK